MFFIAILPTVAYADPGTIPLFHYGTGDGNLHQPTAFAKSWMRPDWVPDRVLKDWPGIALAEYPPGTKVQITVVGLPKWAASWPELDNVIGRSTIAYIADRPGASWYGDAWGWTFNQLAPHWVGKLWVEVIAMDTQQPARFKHQIAHEELWGR